MKFINRAISGRLLHIASKYPVVFLTGPRQSGKSSLLQNLFQEKYEYVSLEEKDTRDFALSDPRGFLNSFKGKVIIDEAQRAPDLFSYIQTRVDKKQTPGMYILSGSQNFLMTRRGTSALSGFGAGWRNISQSLAGRVGILSLLPFSLSELGTANMLPKTADEWMLNGAYPRLFSSKISTEDFFPSYIATYVERDIRLETKIHNFDCMRRVRKYPETNTLPKQDTSSFRTRYPDKFRRFLGITAASTGSPVNLSKLGAEVSIDARTVDSWLSILEESYIIFRLPPYFNNLGKRYIKTPKLYFYDTGLLCALLGFTHVKELKLHGMRGHIFEAAVISETVKKYFNAGQRPRLYYWRDSDNKEKEIDLLEESPRGLELTEIKSSQTANKEYIKNMMNFNPPPPHTVKSRRVIYDGSERPVFSGVRYVNWRSLG